MHPAIGDQEYLAARDLPIEHAANVDPGFAYQKPPQFQHKPHTRGDLMRQSHQTVQVLSNGHKIKRLLPGK